MLMILAWAFSAAAIAAAIHNAVSGTGSTICAVLITASLFLQYFYVQTLKHNKH
jgi:chaperone required for assembly of F1-ATPase